MRLKALLDTYLKRNTEGDCSYLAALQIGLHCLECPIDEYRDGWAIKNESGETEELQMGCFVMSIGADHDDCPYLDDFGTDENNTMWITCAADTERGKRGLEW